MTSNPNSTGTAAAPDIPAWLSSPAELPRDIGLKIAELAGVPAAEREDCADALRGLVWTTSGSDSRSLPTKPSPALRQAADAARALQAAVCDLSVNDHEWVQRFTYYDEPHVQELVRTLPRTISRLTTLLGIAIGRYRYSPLDVVDPTEPLKRGRRPGSFNDPAFHRVVDDVLFCVFAFGGKLTLDKNFEGGTLIAALNELRPYVPAGLIPNVLPLGTLQKIKTAFSEHHR
jgi:hypothetical protein